MFPQYEKTQIKHLAFSRPLLILSQHTEGENEKMYEAARECGLAYNLPTLLPNPRSVNILVDLLSVVLLCRRGEGQGLQLIFKDWALPILSTI